MNCELKKTELNFLARRSIRSYTSKEIEEDKLNKILKAALVSPTGKNLKPFELVVIKDKEMLVKLSESKDSGSNMLKEANMAIVVLGNPEISDLWSDDSSIVSFAISILSNSQIEFPISYPIAFKNVYAIAPPIKM